MAHSPVSGTSETKLPIAVLAPDPRNPRKMEPDAAAVPCGNRASAPADCARDLGDAFDRLYQRALAGGIPWARFFVQLVREARGDA